MKHPARLGFLQRTLAGLARHLVYGGELRLLVSCEVCENDAKTFSQYQNFVNNFTLSDSRLHPEFFVRQGPPGIGDQLNYLLGMVPDDAVVLCIQDDWLLERDLDVTADVRACRDGAADMVRYCWWPEPDDAPTPPAELPGYRLVGPEHKWLYSDTPSMMRRDLLARAGPFLPGITEWEYSERLRRMMQAGDRIIIWGRGEGRPWFTDEFFTHVGGGASTIRGA